MSVDKDPFPMNSAYVKPDLMPINVVGFTEVDDKKIQDQMDLDMFENIEKPIFPKSGEDLLDFLLKQ